MKRSDVDAVAAMLSGLVGAVQVYAGLTQSTISADLHRFTVTAALLMALAIDHLD